MKKILVLLFVLNAAFVYAEDESKLFTIEKKDFLKEMECVDINKKVKYTPKEYVGYLCFSKQDKSIENGEKERLNGGLVFKSNLTGISLQMFDGRPSQYGNNSNLDDFIYMILQIGRGTDWGEYGTEDLDKIALGYGKLVYPNGKISNIFNMRGVLVYDTLYIKAWEDTIYKEIINIPMRDLYVLELLMQQMK